MPEAAPNSSREAIAAMRAWLAGKSTEPMASETELVEAFLRYVGQFDFALQLVNHGGTEAPIWSGYWTHRGSSFAGFKQAEDHPDPNVTRLLACTALLQNQWCLERLA